MKKFIAAAAVPAVLAAGLLAAPAQAKPVAKKPAAFVVSALKIIGHHRTYDVATSAAVVKVRVQVKDRSRAFDPASVKLVVVKRETGLVETFVVTARRVGASKVVTNWLARIMVPKGSVAPGAKVVYTVTIVKVTPDSPAALPMLKTAKGLAGRDSFTVVNSATA